MPLTLKTDQSVANTAAERWRMQYQRGTQWGTIRNSVACEDTYNRLVKLGPTPDPVMVTEIIGNDSWSTAPECDNCGQKTGCVMTCGQEPDYESSAANLCASCLREALTIIENTKGAK